MMRMPSAPRLAPALAALLLAGCASAPAQYYTLVRPAAAPSAPSDLRIDVLPVTVPTQVDVPQLVIRQSDTEVALVENQQWIAPLGQEVRAAIAAELVTSLGAQDLSGTLRAPSAAPAYRIRLDLRRFDSSPGRSVLIEAVWSVRRSAREHDPAVCISRVEQPAAAGYPALVEAHQRALQRIAAQIAQAIRAAQAADAAVNCPD